MTATLADSEASVAALEAEHADYRAVLTVINALSQQTRERHDLLDARIDRLDAKVDAGFTETSSRIRSLEESTAEIKNLLIRALDGK